ncbi:MAG: ATP-binding cassette domain-containing protein [Candidatus Heimdallarchaeota archaeon]|nr:ATP-binding cassette domain-containing protein [Candidatus Heimdallarchaeota archaeon]MCK5048421.1 ATP-binding cassette domain-containing protein [Candidatus Heimdallarchaeota archaeon]
MLEIRNLGVKYKRAKEWALKEVNLQAKEGELIVIAGPSGSGKSTLAQTILGLIPAFINAEIEGEIRVKGQKIESLTRKKRVETFAYVPQYPADFATSLLVEEEIAFPLENMAFPREEIITRIDQVLDLLEINHLRMRLTTELSSGEMQKVALATALALSPPIIVLDEPMARIDPQTETRLAELLRKIADQGHLVLAFEHRLDYLLGQADRVVIIEEGAIVEDGEPQEAITSLEKINLPGITKMGLQLFNTPFLTINDAISAFSKEPKKFDILMEKTLNDQSSPTANQEGKEKIEEDNGFKLSNVSFGYSKRRSILEQINWEVMEGTTIGLMGSNGTGKTTLLKLVAGLLRSSEGVVFFENEAIKGIKNTKGKVILVPENAKLFLIGPTPREDLEKVIAPHEVVKLFKKYQIEHLLDKKLYHLSEGQRRLVAIICAFQFSQKVILLDEPTIGLDANGRGLLFNLLRKAKKEEKIVIVSSNDPRVFPEVDEIIVLENKQIILKGEPRKALYELEKKTKLVPNQIVRFIQELQKSHKRKLSHFLTVNEIGGEN